MRFADGFDVDYKKKRMIQDPKIFSLGRCLGRCLNGVPTTEQGKNQCGWNRLG